jgi:hypothetical protein
MAARTTKGFVYAITNEAWPGWVKVGRATNPTARLSSYQTGDPTQSYRLAHLEPVADAPHAEFAAHERLKKLGYTRRGEWFETTVAAARRAIRTAARTPAPTY